jgi:hemoglobin-like flavoprotein
MSITRHPLFSGPDDLRDVPLDRALAARLQASFGALAQRSDAFAARFYERLFGKYPELRPMFPADMSNQRRKLVATLEQVVKLLEVPFGSRRLIEDLGREHARVGARREHYPLVIAEMLAAMAEHGGPGWNAELEADWRQMLELLARGMTAELDRP